MEPTQFVAYGSLAVAGAALVLGRWDKLLEKQKRVMVTITETSLWSPTAYPPEWALEVRSGQTKIAAPRVLRVEFRNVGRIELKESDIYVPPSVEVPDGTVLAASAHLLTRSSAARKPVTGLIRKDNRVEALKMLLNPGDALAVQLLVDGGTQPAAFNLHAGGFEVTDDESQSPAGLLTKIVGVAAISVAAIAAVFSLFL